MGHSRTDLIGQRIISSNSLVLFENELIERFGGVRTAPGRLEPRQKPLIKTPRVILAIELDPRGPKTKGRDIATPPRDPRLSSFSTKTRLSELSVIGQSNLCVNATAQLSMASCDKVTITPQGKSQLTITTR